ncbi:MAG: VOC family protein [Asgard group archaeon]|nr:VOC family protein [Asgard group archaeon]
MNKHSSILTDHIVGFGGFFFKSKDPKGLTKWCQELLGFTTQVPYTKEDTAITFRWKSFDGVNQNTVWAPFKEGGDYFAPSQKKWMINLIVKDIEQLLTKLLAQGVQQIGKIEEESYGKFAWILDPEDNKIELWEPNREFFADKY